ncbi:hypothetical protein GCM10027299_21780 [Larkinella ripae]
MEWINHLIIGLTVLAAAGICVLIFYNLSEIFAKKREGLPNAPYIPPRPPRGAFAPKRADNEPPLPPRERYFKNEAEIKGEALQRVYEREDMIDYIIKYSPYYSELGHSVASRELSQRADHFIETLAYGLWLDNTQFKTNEHGKEETSR